ncbi:unnamed protein product, partial [Staurois parvus]
MYTHIHVHTQKYTCAHTHVHTHICTCTHTHTHMYTCTRTHTPPPHKKLQYFIVHSQIQVLHSRGRQRAQHTLLTLLSLRSATEQSDRFDLSSEPAQQDGPGGHTRPHHNFHSPLASRLVEISSPGVIQF